MLIAERNGGKENCKLVANLLIHPEVYDRVAAGVGQGQPQEDSVDIAHSSGWQSGQGPKQQLGNKHYKTKSKHNTYPANVYREVASSVNCNHHYQHLDHLAQYE